MNTQIFNFNKYDIKGHWRSYMTNFMLKSFIHGPILMNILWMLISFKNVSSSTSHRKTLSFRLYNIDIRSYGHFLSFFVVLSVSLSLLSLVSLSLSLFLSFSSFSLFLFFLSLTLSSLFPFSFLSLFHLPLFPLSFFLSLSLSLSLS